MAAENFGLHDVVKYGLISLGYAVDPGVFSSAENFAFCSWSQAIMSLIPASIDLECVLRAGIKTLIRLNGPQTWSGHISLMALAKGNTYVAMDSLQSLGNPSNSIRIGFLTASLANCRLLGLDPCAIMNHDAESPFVRSAHYAVKTKHGSHIPYSSDSPEIQQHSPRGFAGDMCPTVEQLIIPHHPYLDIIPWPSFRSRAIIASSMNPPLIDKSELCLDLLNNGVYCYSVPGISLNGRGEGMPWDSRSWEAKPWFLKKWAILVAGIDVQQTSLWWQSRA
ncbi:hypothetical protein ACHAPJ_013083 [Fusarium lateritium]